MGFVKTLFVKNEIFANPTAFQSAAAHSCEL